MSELDIDLDKILADHPVEQQDTVLQINPQLIISVVSVTTTLLEERSDLNELEALYRSSKEFLIQTGFKFDNETMAPALFSLYVEAYRGLKAYQQTINPRTIDPRDNPQLLYNEAALSIFDLYKKMPYDSLVRKLLVVTAQSLHDVITQCQAANECSDMGVLMTDLSTVALLAHTLKTYVKGTKRRRANYPYVDWLKGFFNHSLLKNDVSFVRKEKRVISVVAQVTRQERIIDLEAI